MKGVLTDLTMGMDGRQRLTISTAEDARGLWEDLHEVEVDVQIKKWRARRSLDANAYFHVLCNKMAAVLNISDTECKRNLVFDYGALDRDEDGKIIGAKLPASVDVTRYYNYAKEYMRETVDGREYIAYVFYKPTHELDTKEMARLIDGTIQEAKGLGIETAKPWELGVLNRNGKKS